MNVVILYRFGSEQERSVIEFEKEYESRTGRQLSRLNIDTVEGDSLARLYDVINYPAVIARTEDGQLLQVWQSEKMPLINEVMFYDKTN